MSIQKVLINEKTIQERTRQLAQEITEDYKGKKLTMICILKGSIYFFTDLTRRIDLETELEFVRISSYEGENSTGDIKLKVDLDNPVTGKDVIVVEDIIDTGKTLAYFLDHLKKQKPNSLRLCTLLNKPERREVDNVDVDYIGFTIPNRFVIGYGLDLDEQYRNIPEVKCIIKEDEEKQIQKDSREIKKQLLKTPQKKEY